ncbi:MAG: hypothetical protein AAFX87_24305 [Bacteroidota bacterium]
MSNNSHYVISSATRNLTRSEVHHLKGERSRQVGMTFHRKGGDVEHDDKHRKSIVQSFPCDPDEYRERLGNPLSRRRVLDPSCHCDSDEGGRSNPEATKEIPWICSYLINRRITKQANVQPGVSTRQLKPQGADRQVERPDHTVLEQVEHAAQGESNRTPLSFRGTRNLTRTEKYLPEGERSRQVEMTFYRKGGDVEHKHKHRKSIVSSFPCDLAQLGRLGNLINRHKTQDVRQKTLNRSCHCDSDEGGRSNPEPISEIPRIRSFVAHRGMTESTQNIIKTSINQKYLA